MAAACWYVLVMGYIEMCVTENRHTDISLSISTLQCLAIRLPQTLSEACSVDSNVYIHKHTFSRFTWLEF